MGLFGSLMRGARKLTGNNTPYKGYSSSYRNSSGYSGGGTKKGFSLAGNKKENYYLYILRLSNNGLYVGITNNPNRRWMEHATARGAKITHIYPPVGVVGCVDLGYMTYAQAEKYEDAKTLELMEMYGLSSVRGGHWAMVNDKAIYGALSHNARRIYKDFGRDVSRMLR